MNSCPKCASEFGDSVRICPNDGTILESGVVVDARIGTLLDGKYKLDAPLGEGGMGTIYRATHLMLDKPVAVKLIKGDSGKSPEIVRRFQREARAASNLNHPNIAAAYDLGQTSDGTLYIAMELVRGPSLKDLIRASGPLAAQRIGRILRQVASALAVAHRHGIIHRDLKPQNIMLATEADGTEVAKLLDFGIAKTHDEQATQLTPTGFVIGTPLYMSPEQAAGRPIDARSDLYSLGIIMFEMLVGEVPFNDPSTPALLVKHLTEPAPVPSRRRPDLHIAPELEAVALRCMEKDPAARFQSADEFVTALNAALGTDATTAPRAAVMAGLATVIVPRPGAAALRPAIASRRAPTPSSSAETTGRVSSPATPSAAALTAAAGGAMAPPPRHRAGVRARQRRPRRRPASRRRRASASAKSNPTGRNALIIAAVVVLVIGAGAYAAGTWYRGRVRPVAVASVAPTDQPPAVPADATPTATPPAVPPATTSATPPPDPPAAAPPSTPSAPPNSGSGNPPPSQSSSAGSVSTPPATATVLSAQARGATKTGAASAGTGSALTTGGAGNRQSRGRAAGVPETAPRPPRRRKRRIRSWPSGVRAGRRMSAPRCAARSVLRSNHSQSSRCRTRLAPTSWSKRRLRS